MQGQSTNSQMLRFQLIIQAYMPLDLWQKHAARVGYGLLVTKLQLNVIFRFCVLNIYLAWKQKYLRSTCVSPSPWFYVLYLGKTCYVFQINVKMTRIVWKKGYLCTIYCEHIHLKTVCRPHDRCNTRRNPYMYLCDEAVDRLLIPYCL
jgi:hypothetical protein